MKINRSFNSLLTALCGVILVACGGGGGGGPAIGGIDGTGITSPPIATGTVAFGTVTAFGSVFVNGVRFDTSSANFAIDGEAGSQDDLSVGDIVLVTGTLNAGSTTEGVATSIVFDDAVEGPIAAGSINIVENTLIVLGQTVRISAETLFDDSIQPGTLAGLIDGDIVEVSGFAGSDGSIAATRIERKPPGLLFETTGLVSNLDTASFSFTINDLVVDYTSALMEDFQAGVITDGDLVEIKGNTFGAGGELIATRVELKGDDLRGDNGANVEMEGFITRFSSMSDFDINGIRVTTSSQTLFEGGVAGDLRIDIKVEAEGRFNAEGQLVADKISFRRASIIRVMASIESVDPENNSFTVLGIDVVVNRLTRLEDRRDDLGTFSVSDLAVGDYVEVRGSEQPSGSGDILATIVKRQEFSTDTELRGFVQSLNNPTLQIMGVTVTTDSGTQFSNAAELVISATEFFTQVQVGTLVDIDGVSGGPQALLAEEAEIEIEN